MKAEYKTPSIEMTRFLTEDIITDSSIDSGTTASGTVANAEIPQVVDVENLFNYN